MSLKNVLISPIYAVLPDLNDCTTDFILCSSELDIEKINQKNVLALHFYDTIEANNTMCFKPHQADRIKNFLSRAEASDDLFVCCDSGESRSSAIAAAILLYIGKDDLCIWSDTGYHPNQLVFKEMCKTFGIGISEAEIRKRVHLNTSTFHNAIMNSYNCY